MVKHGEEKLISSIFIEYHIPFQTLFQVFNIKLVAIMALEGLKGDLEGRYYRLSEMTEQDQQRLIDVSGLESSGLAWGGGAVPRALMGTVRSPGELAGTSSCSV